MQVPRNEQWNAAAHGGSRLQQAIMLCAPTRLPIRLRLGGGHSAIGFHVRIPFAPLACAPTGRSRWNIDHMRRVGPRHAVLEPGLDLGRHEYRARPVHGQVAPAVVHQHLGKTPVAQRAVALRDTGRPVRRGGRGQSERTHRVRQKFRVVKVLRCTPGSHHERVRREADETIVRLVVLEVVVVVLHEEHGRRAAERRIERHDLRPHRLLENRLVRTSKDRRSSIEAPGDHGRLGGRPRLVATARA
jgi:hypothetical protein